MSDDVINTLKESLKRKLRYHEGRLANGISSNAISEIDKKMHEEEIGIVSEQLEKLNEAVLRIKS